MVRGVEMSQMTAGAVEEKTENLFEEFRDRQALWMLAHGAEQAVQVGIKIDPTQVADEEI